MSLFNTPGPSVTSEELERIFSTLRSRHATIPHDLFELWRGAAMPYMAEHEAKYRGMDAKELESYMAAVRSLTQHTHPQFVGIIPEFKVELQKAIKGTYGNPMGI